MLSRSTTRRVVAGLALAITAGVLAGCTDDGTGPAGDDTGAAGGAVPDVLSAYPKDNWNVTISSVAFDQSDMRPMQEWYMDEVERRTGGAIMFHRTTNNEICAQSDQYSCVQSGAAGLLVQVPNYQPTVFTPSSLPEITFGGDNAAAITAAIDELGTTNADVQAFWAGKGLVPVATWSVGRILLGSKVPLDGLDDLTGLSMRTAGTIAAPDLAAAGVVPAQVTADEAYNALSTGVVQAAAGAIDFAYALKLGEVLPYWVDPGLGVYSEFSMYWSKAQWDEFPADVQAVLEDINETATSSGKWVDLWQDGYDSQPMDDGAPAHFLGAGDECTAIQAMPSVKSMTAWDASTVAAFEALGAKTDSGTTTNDALWVKNATAAGLTNAQGVLDQYEQLYAKYAAQFTDAKYATDPVTTCIQSFQR